MVREAHLHGFFTSWNTLKTELTDLDEAIIVYSNLRSARVITERSTAQQCLYGLFALKVYLSAVGTGRRPTVATLTASCGDNPYLFGIIATLFPLMAKVRFEFT